MELLPTLMTCPFSSESRQSLADLDLAFPAPARGDISLTTPSLETSFIEGLVPTTQWSSCDVEGLTSAQPGVVKPAEVVTPLQEVAPFLPLDSIVGADVHPAPLQSPVLVDSLQPSPDLFHSKGSRGLRLPSFDLLGIANPHPNRVSHTISSPTSVGAADPTHDEGVMDTIAALRNSVTHSADGPFEHESPKAHRHLAPSTPREQFITTLTPPEEQGGASWNAVRMVGVGPMDSPVTDTGSTARSPESQAATAIASVSGASVGQPRIQVHRSDSDRARETWLDEACNVMMESLHFPQHLETPVKVLSHALPCPTNTGFAYPIIINSLHNQTPGSSTCWINAFHALPGRYNLSDLPTSPPGTPGPAIGGDDYFTSKVFDSAVPVLDYQEVTPMSRTPRPVVPPASINVSIVERYIPPTNVNEFSELFSVNGRSLLADRLVELSPNDGTLLFIYPTRIGAQTFSRDYLGPILDPLLRSMCIINGLSVDLGSDLGKMMAINSMHSFESLKAGILRLCSSLSQQSRSLERFHGKQASFEMKYASKEQVKIDRKVWAENWWIKQEKPRVRAVISKYFRLARKLPVDADVTPTALIHEVLDGVASRPYGNVPPPTAGIEVGIFVIKRTA